MKPNIIFIFSDQQHWEALGCVDSTFTTPNLDKFATQSIRFTDAFCTTPQCSPSRSSILTGLYPSKTGVWGNHEQAGGPPLRNPTIGSVLQQAGYETAYFGKWHLGKEPEGTAGWQEDFGVTGPETRDDGEVTRRALKFLEARKSRERPFALFLSYNNPHDICRFGLPENLDCRSELPLPENWHGMDFSRVPSPQRDHMKSKPGRYMEAHGEKAWKRYREFYREKVALFDQEVGEVLDRIKKLGLFENSLITITSDHGDMDGNHRLLVKGPFLYEHLVRVPLLVKPPASTFPSGSATESFMTMNTDLAPTLADFAGVKMRDCDGFSLKPLLCGQPMPNPREEVFFQYYSKKKWVNPLRGIRTRRFKYNLYQLHGEELYDLEKDPGEIHNLAGNPEFAEVQAELAQRLQEWMRKNQDPFPDQCPTTKNGNAIPFQT